MTKYECKKMNKKYKETEESRPILKWEERSLKPWREQQKNGRKLSEVREGATDYSDITTREQEGQDERVTNSL